MVYFAAQTNLRLKENSLVPELLQTNMDQIFLFIDTCGFPIMHLDLHESDLCRSFSTSLQDKTKPKRKPPNRSRPTKQIKKDGGEREIEGEEFHRRAVVQFLPLLLPPSFGSVVCRESFIWFQVSVLCHTISNGLPELPGHCLMSCRSFGYGSVGVYPSPALTVERQGRCQGGPTHSPVRDTQPVSFPSLPTLCACLLQHCPGQSTITAKNGRFCSQVLGPANSHLPLQGQLHSCSVQAQSPLSQLLQEAQGLW